ncbi:cytochrome c3 family protein [Geoalkalibacter halelectricus]|uniref:Cytochrome c3 family protein n=1 Tax=Geoalkalibacter halelectricus TaxID=2847045 RepID=A0ABY5ZQ79_9BACT|nr:cytochrome c3 family protein [Geoalkalibacter halelectricus]MDO3377394.1 cytochrome c3 family protein [Geoalkalibacter halelectricus]UWZ80846.1 cytochrome c3 family protein [Geoalkalibacter halelectricus]
MKKFAAIVLVVLFAAATGIAAQEIYTYEARNGNVTFDHQKHIEYEGGTCVACHGEGEPGPIAIDRDSAHGASCKDCHDQKGGPTRCGECHIR